jgi:hypothetical protein
LVQVLLLIAKQKNGKVPSGKDYQEYMIDSLCNKFEELNETKGEMYKESFSKIAELYIKQIDDIDKRNYFVSNFTDVKIGRQTKMTVSLTVSLTAFYLVLT